MKFSGGAAQYQYAFLEMNGKVYETLAFAMKTRR